MRKLIFPLLLAFAVSASSAFAGVSHLAFDQLLQKHVSPTGKVNYDGFKADEAQLNTYLQSLSGANLSSLSRKEKMAFWINVYNAYTIKTILDNRPLTSITNIKKDGKDAWHLPVVKAAGKTLTLNQVEHDMLLKQFGDPRVHFAINCASFSCPKLLNRAFTADNLEESIEQLARAFVNDPKRNRLNPTSPQVSEIFKWYVGDFTKEGTVIQFLNKYAKVKIQSNAKLGYLPYNWNLNN